jgi:hypothetical protein
MEIQESCVIAHFPQFDDFGLGRLVSRTKANAAGVDSCGACLDSSWVSGKSGQITSVHETMRMNSIQSRKNLHEIILIDEISGLLE